MSVESILPDRFKVGEGGYWDEKSDSLVFVDVVGHAVFRYHPNIPRFHRMNTDKDPHFAIPRSNGQGLVITQGNSIDLLDEKTGKTTPFVTSEQLGLQPGEVINDGKCDAKGRLWCGTFKPGGELTEREKWKPAGSIFRISADGSVSKQADQIVLSNGLDWTTDNRTMVFADSFAQKIYAFDFDLEKGELSNRRVCVHFSNDIYDIPDGLCIDADDKMWVAMVLTGKVSQFDIHTGKELQSISFPCLAVTCPNFGGKDYSEMFVTSSSEIEMPTPNWPKSEPEAGALFKVSGLKTKGKAPYQFAG